MILFREKMLYLLKVTFIKCISAKYISTCKEDTIFTQGRYNLHARKIQSSRKEDTIGKRKIFVYCILREECEQSQAVQSFVFIPHRKCSTLFCKQRCGLLIYLSWQHGYLFVKKKIIHFSLSLAKC